MSNTEQILSILEKLNSRVDELYYLVLGGGKESRLVETIPTWRNHECDSSCDYTDTPIPSKRRVKLHGLKVHPGVKAWAQENDIQDIQTVDPAEVPDDYLRVPPVTRLRQRYVPTSKISWTDDQLELMDRSTLHIVARDSGLQAVCQTIHESLDWRLESREWIIGAVRLIAQHECPLEAAKKLKFKSDRNKENLATAKKDKTGGGTKTTTRKKASKKSAKKGKK